MTEDLGRLERVDLRDIWRTEAQDFTPWLGRDDNLSILGETIGIELELEAQEKEVGPFRADLLCKDTASGDWVLIENQLERTDHVHLGQILTYGAGLQAVTIVWIAATFTDEHRATLDWLNDITDQRFQFFGLEVELWRIGDSQAAPKFNIVSKPNDWTRSVGQSARRISNDALSELQILQREYWANLGQVLLKRNSPIRSAKPRPQHWVIYAIGKSGMHLTTTVNMKHQRLGVELYLGDENAKAHFKLLEMQRAEIEAELGIAANWQELPERKGSRIVVYKDNTDPADESDWPAQHAWMADMLERFDRVFRPRVKELDASEWSEEADGASAG